MNPTYEAVTYTPAGQCVVALTLALGGTWSLPEEGEPNIIERAASGDTQALQWVCDLGAGLGALPGTVELVISALADARAHVADDGTELAETPVLLSALVMRLVDEHYPEVESMAFAEALMSTRSLEVCLIKRLHGETMHESEESAAQGMHAFVLATHPLPADPIGVEALPWVEARKAEWLELKLRVLRAGRPGQ